MIEQFLASNSMLRERTKTWLRHNPDQLQAFIDSDYTRNQAHYRALTSDEQYEWWHWGWTAEEFEAERERWRTCGTFIADEIYHAANREGFMRKFLRKDNEHTVREFTREEEIRATRVLSRLKKPRSEIRPIARAMRTL
jgi:hypothetical protein